MTFSAIGNRYANALADVVTAPGSAAPAEKALADLHSFRETIESSAELKNVLSSPAVPPARKRAVAERIAATLGLDRITRNFLFVLIDHRRIGAMAEIVEAFDRIVDERLGFARAEVTSAAELTERQRSALGAELERMTGRKIRMRCTVDPALIGGAVARIGSTVYDGSVRGQLENLGRTLRAGA